MQNQIFSIIYKGACYMVDPFQLSNSCISFKEIITPYINNGTDFQSIHLKISCDRFSSRGINNFLKICQNLPTDVKDSEIIEICEIATMFQAEKIYNTSIEFIQNNIDGNFSMPFDKFKGDYLIIEAEDSKYVHDLSDFEEVDFDESYEYSPEDTSSNVIVNSKPKKIPSACYQIKIENPFMKCRRFLLMNGDKVLFTAKQKNHQVFISEGNEVHINEKNKKNAAVITQSRQGYNIVKTEDQDFKINYLRTNPDEFKKCFSMKLTFVHRGFTIFWSPQAPSKPNMINGEYNHQPINSKKNILLQNKAHHTTFIVRKMDKKLYEAECHSTFSPLIAFSIALSQIVGPFM